MSRRAVLLMAFGFGIVNGLIVAALLVVGKEPLWVFPAMFVEAAVLAFIELRERKPRYWITLGTTDLMYVFYDRDEAEETLARLLSWWDHDLGTPEIVVVDRRGKGVTS